VTNKYLFFIQTWFIFATKIKYYTLKSLIYNGKYFKGKTYSYKDKLFVFKYVYIYKKKIMQHFLGQVGPLS